MVDQLNTGDMEPDALPWGDAICATALVMKAWPLVCLFAGCGSSVGSAPSLDVSRLVSLIAIVDSDQATYVPPLPDDFDSTRASTPSTPRVRFARDDSAEVPPPMPDDAPLPPPGRDQEVSPRSDLYSLPGVLVYGPSGCEPCQKVIDEINASRKFTATKAPLSPAIIDIANRYGQGTFPSVVTFRDCNGKELFVMWQGVRDLELHYQRTTALQSSVPATMTMGSKTVRVQGLRSALKWAQPAVKSIVGNTLQLADGVTLNLPDDTVLKFSATSDPNTIRVEFSGITATIHRSVLGFAFNATEPVTFADVSRESVSTRVSVFKITAVDDQ